MVVRVQNKRRRFPFGVAVGACAAAAAYLLVGCGGGSGRGPGMPSDGTGRLEVVMVDAPPAPDVTAVNVTIGRVEANINGEWVDVAQPAGPVTVNLLDLARQEVLIGADQIPAGAYTQVRFFPEGVSVTDSTGTQPVNVPSADQTGIKVNLNYTVEPGAVTSVLLDFNVAKSLKKTGNGRWQLQPVIPAVVRTASGTVSGRVVDGLAGAAPVAGASVSAVYTAGTAYPLGTEVNTATSLAPDGVFKVWALLPGTYTLTAKVAAGTPEAPTERVVAVENVVVTAGQSADAGTLTLP